MTSFVDRMKAKKALADKEGNNGPSADQILKAKLQKEVDKAMTIFTASSIGNLTAVQQFLENGVKADDIDPLTDSTPLMLAARGGFPDICAHLITKGNVDVNARGFGGMSALHHCCKNSHSPVVDVLLAEPTIDVELQDDAGNTAIMYAARMGNLTCLDKLAAKGANIDHANHHKSTAFIVATIHAQPAIIDSLVKLDADINARDSLGNTSLHYAAMSGHIRTVRQLLHHNVRVGVLNATDKDATEVAATQEVKSLLLNFQPGDV